MIHFMTGLPRAGTTLLAAILRQNPRFHAGITTPLGRIYTQALQAMNAENEAVTETFLPHERRVNVLRAVVNGFYQDVTAPVTFDMNRRWTANLASLVSVFPESRVICLVRDPAAIIDSFERLFQKHPLYLSNVYSGRANLTVYDRIGAMMAHDGVLGFPFNALKTAFFGLHADRMFLISYDNLVQHSRRVMDELHDVIREPRFAYNFENIEDIPGTRDFDMKIHTPGLHSLKTRVVYEPRDTVLPPDVFPNLPPAFWLADVNKVATTAR